jgi:hypothetical protein
LQYDLKLCVGVHGICKHSQRGSRHDQLLPHISQGGSQLLPPLLLLLVVVLLLLLLLLLWR